jgi:hypothetical protein
MGLEIHQYWKTFNIFHYPNVWSNLYPWRNSKTRFKHFLLSNVRQQNGQKKKDKQRSTKHYAENERSSNMNPTKTGGELKCSWKVSSSCFTRDTRRMKINANNQIIVWLIAYVLDDKPSILFLFSWKTRHYFILIECCMPFFYQRKQEESNHYF